VAEKGRNDFSLYQEPSYLLHLRKTPLTTSPVKGKNLNPKKGRGPDHEGGSKGREKNPLGLPPRTRRRKGEGKNRRIAVIVSSIEENITADFKGKNEERRRGKDRRDRTGELLPWRIGGDWGLLTLALSTIPRIKLTIEKEGKRKWPMMISRPAKELIISG